MHDGRVLYVDHINKVGKIVMPFRGLRSVLMAYSRSVLFWRYAD